MKNYIKQELDEVSFTQEEIQQVIEQFSKETYLNEKMSQTMRDINIWITVLKRLIIRILIPIVDLTIPIEMYLQRSDLWNDNINENDLDNMKIGSNIMLKHAYVIFKGLNEKVDNGQKKQDDMRDKTESDESNTKIRIDNEFDSHTNLSTLSTSSHSSLNNVEEQATLISSEALRYANSISYPPIIITGVPAFTSHSSLAIVQFLRSLVNAHPTLPRISDTSWRLNNKNQLLLCAPTRDVYSLLLTNNYPSTIGTSTIQVIPLRRLPAQLSPLLLNVPGYLDDSYFLEEIQKHFRSVKYLHRIRTFSNTNNSTLVCIDFENAQECDQCLQAQYLSVANVRLVIKQYLGPPRIPQCTKCCSFVHFANHCSSTHKICNKCATSILIDTNHQCSSIRCINCSKLPNHPFDINHDAFDHHCPSMLNFKKMLVTKLVEQGIVSNHIYVPKELQHRLRQVRERLPPVTPISSRPILSTAARHATGNTTNTIAPKLTSTTVIVPQSSRSISNFIDFMQTTVKPFEDQLSNLAKQMTNLTVLFIIQEYKIDYVSSLVEKIMLPSFKLITETLPALVHLILDSSMHVNQKETISNQLQKTSMFLNTACEQHQSF
ncbi:unnamed protein product [Rotaria sordida]|uniref:Uncharacterized protein n=1 Tax=Rotaria sordida TaxID=392033 RepID=A0A814MKF3_9BILA|nr:unnamed protein product [Rotaria sordida]CAF1266606.1 unnamed protein product [Rotaria sordida]